MSNIVIMIREPDGDCEAANALLDLIRPYLRTQQVTATLSSSHRLRGLTGKEGQHRTAISLAVSGPGLADLGELAHKTHGFLKRAAKDASLVAEFDILVEVETHGADKGAA